MPTKLDTLKISYTASIKEAIQRLEDTGKKILFITKTDGRYSGTLTDGDIRKSLLHGKSLSCFIEFNDNSCYLRERNIDMAKELFRRFSIHAIPIIDKDNFLIDCIFIEDLIEQVKDIPVVIMAGGKGTRIYPVSSVIPKPLIPVNDKPLLSHIIEDFVRQGFKRFIITVGFKADTIKNYISVLNLPYDISFIEDTEPTGTAGSLHGFKAEKVIVVNCDSLVKIDWNQALASMHPNDHGIVIGFNKTEDCKYGRIITHDRYLAGISNIPVTSSINTGAYILKQKVLDLIEPVCDMPDILNKSTRIAVAYADGFIDYGS